VPLENDLPGPVNLATLVRAHFAVSTLLETPLIAPPARVLGEALSFCWSSYAEWVSLPIEFCVADLGEQALDLEP